MLGEIAADIADQQRVRIGDVKGRAQVGGFGGDETAKEEKRGDAGEGLREEDESGRNPGNGKNEAERGAEDPGKRRIEDVAGLAEAVVGPRGPMRGKDAVLPLVGDVEPRGDVEFEIVAGGAAEPEKGEQQGQGGEQGYS